MNFIPLLHRCLVRRPLSLSVVLFRPSSVALAAFESPNFPPLGRLGVSMRYRRDLVLPQPRGPFRVQTKIDSRVVRTQRRSENGGSTGERFGEMFCLDNRRFTSYRGTPGSTKRASSTTRCKALRMLLATAYSTLCRFAPRQKGYLCMRRPVFSHQSSGCLMTKKLFSRRPRTFCLSAFIQRAHD